MNSKTRLVFALVVIFLVISACFIDPVDAKKKKKNKDLKKSTTSKVTSAPPSTEPKYEIRTGDGEEEIDPETMGKIQARIKEKGYEGIIRDHQLGKIKDNDPLYVEMLDDLVKQTVKIELTPLGTEIIEERPLTPEEVLIEERREEDEKKGIFKDYSEYEREFREKREHQDKDEL